jgi:hypothetical protein
LILQYLHPLRLHLRHAINTQRSAHSRSPRTLNVDMSYLLGEPAQLLRMGAGLCGVDITRAAHEPRLRSKQEVDWVVARANGRDMESPFDF